MYPTIFQDPALYMWTAEQIAGVTNNYDAGDEDTFLTLEDGQILTTLRGLSNGITVDEAGNVFISLNGFNGQESAVVMWNGTAGEAGTTLMLLPQAPKEYTAWFGPPNG